MDEKYRQSEGRNAVALTNIHTYLVHARKGTPGTSIIKGSAVPRTVGKLYELLELIYRRSDSECDIDITFVPKNGTQQNDCRDLICSYVAHPTISNGRALAEWLEQNTDGRSGLGLLFLMVGQEGRSNKVILSRFPTDNAIHVDESQTSLSVQFLERVFRKNKSSYKAVLYEHSSVSVGFWSVKAIDKQSNAPPERPQIIGLLIFWLPNSPLLRQRAHVALR
jgi:hypothetical protein